CVHRSIDSLFRPATILPEQPAAQLLGQQEQHNTAAIEILRPADRGSGTARRPAIAAIAQT
ncbi:hypothetical protein, partial [Bradyrhizobium elkanii]|uniref:hypothetical protein n=1 Tax=Bradyrhizobium elkanii TaxID=29448 RepID=UPI001AEE7E76